MIVKVKKQNFATLKETHGDLYESIQGCLKHLSDEDKGIVAGLVIEYLIKSDGDISVLEEEFNFEEEMENEDEF